MHLQQTFVYNTRIYFIGTYNIYNIHIISISEPINLIDNIL